MLVVQGSRVQGAKPGVKDLWVNLILEGGQNVFPELLGLHFALLYETLELPRLSADAPGLHTGFSTGVERLKVA